MKSMASAKFIVFEGIDGAGSTTQLNLLFDYLKKQKISAITTAEPTDRVIGRLIRDVLQKKYKVPPKALQLLYCADRNDHLENEILPAIKMGKFVLCDRYFYSTIAYGGLNLDWKWLVSITSDSERPDIVIFIDTPTKVAMSRMKGRKNKELFEKEKLLNNVRKNYLKLLKNDKNCLLVDGAKSKKEIFNEVLKGLKERKIING